jgi:rhodanese-related sulfurtransferase
MDKAHSPRFLAVVADAKSRVNEVTIDEVRAKLAAGHRFHLVDVREESEFAAGHVPGAIHLGKGVIERDVERVLPDVDAEIVCYCGGGYRSALACDSLQRMGYTNVWSMAGGYRAWTLPRGNAGGMRPSLAPGRDAG